MFLDIFSVKKPVMAMLHMKGNTRAEKLDQCLREADIYFENGADAVIVEDYYGDYNDVEAALKMLAEKRKYFVGVNVLDDVKRSWEFAEEYGGRFIQIDSVAGHLPMDEDGPYGEMINSYRSRGGIQVIGGVRFKYKPVLSGNSVEEDLKLGMQRCDAIAVTGEGTGQDSPTQKIIDFRKIVGDFPLIVAAGVTPENVEEKLRLSDAAIIGSAFKDTRKDTGDVYGPHVREIMDRVKALRASL